MCQVSKYNHHPVIPVCIFIQENSRSSQLMRATSVWVWQSMEGTKMTEFLWLRINLTHGGKEGNKLYQDYRLQTVRGGCKEFSPFVAPLRVAELMEPDSLSVDSVLTSHDELLKICQKTVSKSALSLCCQNNKYTLRHFKTYLISTKYKFSIQFHPLALDSNIFLRVVGLIKSWC